MKLFVGGENEKFQTKAMQIGLNPNNIEYLQNLQSEIGADLLKKKKVQIRIDSGQMFFNNVNSGESLYKFLLAKQDTTKKFF